MELVEGQEAGADRDAKERDHHQNKVGQPLQLPSPRPGRPPRLQVLVRVLVGDARAHPVRGDGHCRSRSRHSQPHFVLVDIFIVRVSIFI